MLFDFKTDTDSRALYFTLNCLLFDRLGKNYPANSQGIAEKYSPFD